VPTGGCRLKPDAGFKLLGWNGSAPPGSHFPSVVPGRHHCRWLDHQHNGAPQGMRTVHDAARDRHPLTGAEHERLTPLYLELEPALEHEKELILVRNSVRAGRCAWLIDR
jgi:hypothetical protein